MFNDQQNDQTQEDDQSQSFSLPSLSDNPSPAAPSSSSSDDSTPTVVLPSQAQTSPQFPDSVTTTADTSQPAKPNDLDNIKKQALEQLSPLVSKLDQTPEERFKTLMMMIQASDTQDLIKDAYEAAQKISDEQAKAEALLTIVNEINYFTQQKTA